MLPATELYARGGMDQTGRVREDGPLIAGSMQGVRRSRLPSVRGIRNATSRSVFREILTPMQYAG